MTAKEQLIEAVSEQLSVKYGIREGKTARGEAKVAVDALLAHPDLLLVVLAEAGVLTKETGGYLSVEEWNRTYRSGTRYVSPWVPSGDQT